MGLYSKLYLCRFVLQSTQETAVCTIITYNPCVKKKINATALLPKLNEYHTHNSEKVIIFFSFDRGDMTKPYHYYECKPIRRTLKEVVEIPKIPHGENYC